MKSKLMLVGLALATVTLGGGAMADGIYKWTDENGNVHYEDRPSGAEAAELVALSNRRTDTGAVQNRVDSRLENQASRQEAKAAAAEEAKAAEAEAAEAADRQKKCDANRSRLETYVQSRRLYREGDDGERTYLDEKQVQEARQRLEDLISENCSS